jgi:hypothetical protein
VEIPIRRGRDTGNAAVRGAVAECTTLRSCLQPARNEADGRGRRVRVNGGDRVNIAARLLPVLNLGHHRGWSSIVVYPDEFLVPRAVTDDAGVITRHSEPLSGEAWHGGPLPLSWRMPSAPRPRAPPIRW